MSFIYFSMWFFILLSLSPFVFFLKGPAVNHLALGGSTCSGWVVELHTGVLQCRLEHVQCECGRGLITSKRTAVTFESVSEGNRWHVWCHQVTRKLQQAVHSSVQPPCQRENLVIAGCRHGLRGPQSWTRTQLMFITYFLLLFTPKHGVLCVTSCCSLAHSAYIRSINRFTLESDVGHKNYDNSYIQSLDTEKKFRSEHWGSQCERVFIDLNITAVLSLLIKPRPHSHCTRSSLLCRTPVCSSTTQPEQVDPPKARWLTAAPLKGKAKAIQRRMRKAKWTVFIKRSSVNYYEHFWHPGQHSPIHTLIHTHKQ